MNLSSLVINAQPSKLPDILKELEKLNGVQWHNYNEQGKIIVTIEADNISHELQTLKKIEAINGILSADMVYSYSEELEAQRAHIQPTKPQEILNSNADATHPYSGSVALQLEKALKG